MDVFLGVEDLVGDKVDGCRVINRVCNPPMMGLVRSHYRPPMLITPSPPLVSLVVVRGPMFPHSARNVFLDLGLIFFVRSVIGLGTLRYNVDNDSTTPSPLMIS